ncbi:ABC transporter, phosphonate, substrate-binding protein [Cognatiyoonia koreensis]|uniref:ABC transporter, phosphonate, substrate-binding protein n=1 Tax=Cognatiyoonia koreensis TaxID=364200 RepID=A0A1I0Q6G2_9RHOB|nr:PhnD/SsuA/transferrin family substrate-binding protein [Cognatiyoonia koreensis]SEW22549.1 ABC transporter, phosphonate, substrate-binding protein [Cognatiyoonia koreensis]
MIASLPMYDRPTNAVAHDLFWSLIRDHLRDDGIDAPDQLDRSVLYRDTWSRADLVLGQICIMPYRTSYAKDVTVIGSSDYGLEGCPPGHFRALFVCRHDDPRDLKALSGARFAANAKHSFSGYQSAQEKLADLGLTLPDPLITGSHGASVRSVAQGEADFACIDAQTWRMQQADMPETRHLRVLGATNTAPGQTFITRQSDDPAPYFAAIKSAIVALPLDIRTTLGLRDVVALPASAYA